MYKRQVLYPLKDGLIAKTLYYYDEIAENPRKVPKMQLDKTELEMAKMLVQTMAKPFVAAEFHDEYQERLRNAIMQKIKGNDVLMVEQGTANNVIDLSLIHIWAYDWRGIFAIGNYRNSYGVP